MSHHPRVIVLSASLRSLSVAFHADFVKLLSTFSSNDVTRLKVMNGYPEFGDAPFQLRSSDCYPNLAFGNSRVVYRSFLPSWYDKYQWLHWDAKRERVFCHTCVRASKSKLLFNSKTDPAFITTGFQSWKNALRGFSKHQVIDCHKEAKQKLISVSDTSDHVDKLFSSQIASDRQNNRENLLLILRSIKFLGIDKEFLYAVHHRKDVVRWMEIFFNFWIFSANSIRRYGNGKKGRETSILAQIPRTKCFK